MKLLGWLFFVVYQLLSLALGAVGVIVVFVLSAFNLTTVRPSQQYTNYPISVWRGGWLTWVWGNEEDGVDGTRGFLSTSTGYVFQGDWIAHTSTWSNFRRMYVWSAFRNFCNNLRFLAVWHDGPFVRWESAKQTFYAQAGWNDHGFPVLSLGRI